MSNELRKVLKKPCNTISAVTGIDEYSKRIDLLEHAVLLAECAIGHYDLTDTATIGGVSRSQLSKLDNTRSYQVFVGIFYELLLPFIREHNLHLYGRFLRILGIDSTFIKTAIHESGKYRRSRTEEGIKMQMPALLFPATIPVDALITPANMHDSPLFDDILEDLESLHGEEFLKSSILVFDLGYYDLGRFVVLKLRGIPFVTRIKSNAKYAVIKEYAHSKVVRFSNGLELRLVSLIVDEEEREYLTDIFDLPDLYIHDIYTMRWSIETFFRRMKSLLRLDHLISRKINGIIVQIFAFLIAYLALMIIQTIVRMWSLAEIVRMLRHGVPMLSSNIGHSFRDPGKV